MITKLSAIETVEEYIDYSEKLIICEKCGEYPIQFRLAFHNLIFWLCGKCFFELPINEILRSYHKRQRATHTIS